MKRSIIVFLWLLISYVNISAMTASWNHEFGEGGYNVSCHQLRKDLGVNVMFGSVPLLGSIIAVFGTGFMQDGFAWDWPAIIYLTNQAK